MIMKNKPKFGEIVVRIGVLKDENLLRSVPYDTPNAEREMFKTMSAYQSMYPESKFRIVKLSRVKADGWTEFTGP